MTHPVLTATFGLPASGKSSWARERQAEDPTIVLVSKDELRAMLHASVHSKNNEAQVVRIRNAVVRDALNHGRSVIVHDTNLHQRHIKDLIAIAEGCGGDFVLKDFSHVPLEECLRRDAAREASVGESVIRGMYTQYLEKSA